MSYKFGMEFNTPEERDTYLKEHPGADKSKHTVKEQAKDAPDEEDFDVVERETTFDAPQEGVKRVKKTQGQRHQEQEALLKKWVSKSPTDWGSTQPDPELGKTFAAWKPEAPNHQKLLRVMSREERQLAGELATFSQTAKKDPGSWRSALSGWRTDQTYPEKEPLQVRYDADKGLANFAKNRPDDYKKFEAAFGSDLKMVWEMLGSFNPSTVKSEKKKWQFWKKEAGYSYDRR